MDKIKGTSDMKKIKDLKDRPLLTCLLMSGASAWCWIVTRVWSCLSSDVLNLAVICIVSVNLSFAFMNKFVIILV